MYKDVSCRVKVGDGYSEEFGVGEGVHQGSVLSPLLFIIVLEALSREFRTGCPWELLYADDLMINAESMEEPLVKVQTWKTEIEKKDLRVNMGKTKIMESGINLDVLKKSGKYPCGVCQSGISSSNAIFCGGCKCWVHKKCSGIKGPLRPELKQVCPMPWDCSGYRWKRSFRGWGWKRKAWSCPRVLLPWGHALCSRWLRAGCDHTLQMCMGQVLPIASPSHQSPSAPSDQR